MKVSKIQTIDEKKHKKFEISLKVKNESKNNITEQTLTKFYQTLPKATENKIWIYDKKAINIKILWNRRLDAILVGPYRLIE